MRYLIYSLIIANLLYFAWIRSLPEYQPVQLQPAPIPPGIERLALLSERRAAEAQAGESAATDAGESRVAPASGPVETPADARSGQPAGGESVEQDENRRVCQTVGPLLKKADAESTAKLLAGSKFKAAIRDGEVQEPAGYWVYMPAMASAEARRIVADLDANGMKDYFIGKQNYISLGIFSDRDKARARLKRVNEIGYQAILDQRYRTRTVYWLDIEERRQTLLGSPVWREILSQHSNIRVQRVSCE